MGNLVGLGRARLLLVGNVKWHSGTDVHKYFLIGRITESMWAETYTYSFCFSFFYSLFVSNLEV